MGKVNPRNNTKTNVDLGTKEWEDALMYPLKIIRVSCVVYVIVTLLIPIFQGSKFGIDSFLTFIVMTLMIVGCFSCHGRLFDFTPMIFTMMIRALQFGYYVFLSDINLNLVTFIIIVLCELSLNMLYLVDKSRYSYVKEEEISDEFY